MHYTSKLKEKVYLETCQIMLGQNGSKGVTESPQHLTTSSQQYTLLGRNSFSYVYNIYLYNDSNSIIATVTHNAMQNVLIF